MARLNISDVNAVDTSTVYTGQNFLPEGWHKIRLIGESEEKPTKSGDILGAFFEFEEESSGISFKVWYATDVDARCATPETTRKAAWMLKNTNAMFARIAQVTGSRTCFGTQELYNKPFMAYVVVDEYKYKKAKVDADGDEVVDENGNAIVEEKVFKSNKFKGAPRDCVLSCAEYAKNASKDVASGKIVKASDRTQDDEGLPF